MTIPVTDAKPKLTLNLVGQYVGLWKDGEKGALQTIPADLKFATLDLRKVLPYIPAAPTTGPVHQLIVDGTDRCVTYVV